MQSNLQTCYPQFGARIHLQRNNSMLYRYTVARIREFVQALNAN
jgi:hypothetical protein